MLAPRNVRIRSRRRLVDLSVAVAATVAALTGCDSKSGSASGVDPVAAIQGSYVRGGQRLTIAPDKMVMGGTTLPFTKGLAQAGEGAVRFSDAVVGKGLIFDDKCSGELTVSDSGVSITIQGDSECSGFEGKWEHDTPGKLARATDAVAALEFVAAAAALQSVNAGDNAGRSKAAVVLQSEEMKAGLAWEETPHGDESARVDRMVALLKLDGRSVASGRWWLAATARRVCSPKAAREVCLKAVSATKAAGLSPANAPELRTAIDVASKVWLADGTSKEVAGQLPAALSLYADVCALDSESKSCDQASARSSSGQIRSAQQDMALSHYAAAKATLQAVLSGRNEASRTIAQRLLDSPQFVGGSAMEAAEALRREHGATDDVVAAFDAVCAKEQVTTYCFKARGIADEIRLQLASDAAKAGKYVDAERRLKAVVVGGGPGAVQARTTLESTGFRAGLDSELARQRASNAVQRCDGGQRDCESVANAVLAELGNATVADDVRGALSRHFQALAEGPKAVAAAEAIVNGCRMVTEAESVAGGCFPAGATGQGSGVVKPPTILERVGLGVAAAFLGNGISVGRGVFGIAIAMGVVGAALGLGSGMAKGGRPGKGVVYALLLLAVFGGFLTIRGGVKLADAKFWTVGLGAAP